MKLPIKVSESNYFRLILEFLSPLPPFDTLNGREKDVLSLLLYYNWSVADLDKSQRDAYVFSKPNKNRMRQSLGISRASFDNQLAALRRKSFITYSSILPKFEIKTIDPDLTFSFHLHETTI